jgi:hypothetical protein
MSREKEDHGRISLVFDLWIVNEAGCKFPQDAGSCGICIQEQADIIPGHPKTPLITGCEEEIFECDRVVNSPPEPGDVRILMVSKMLDHSVDYLPC